MNERKKNNQKFSYKKKRRNKTMTIKLNCLEFYSIGIHHLRTNFFKLVFSNFFPLEFFMFFFLCIKSSHFKNDAAYGGCKCKQTTKKKEEKKSML